MGYKTYTDGLTIKAPTAGTQSYASTLDTDLFQDISAHDHTGSPKGVQIGSGAIVDNAVTTAKLAATIKTIIWCGTSTGSANAQVLTPTPAETAYTAGMTIGFLAGYTNTGATTIDISGLGAIALTRLDGSSALVAGDIVAGDLYLICCMANTTGPFMVLNCRTRAIAEGGTGGVTAETARAALGLAIGTNVQAYDLNLTEVAAIAPGTGNFIIGNSGAWELFNYAYYAGYVSDNDTTAAATEYDVFDQDNYPGSTYSITANSRNISLTKSNGRFTVTDAGIYEVHFIPVIGPASGTATGTNIYVKINGSAWLTSKQNPSGQGEACPVTAILLLAAGQYLNFTVDATVANNISVLRGTMVSIKRLSIA